MNFIRYQQMFSRSFVLTMDDPGLRKSAEFK